MPLVTIHPTGTNWRAFEFDASVCTAKVADMLANSLRREFDRGIVTEICVRRPYIVINFSQELPASWCLKVVEAAQACTQADPLKHGEVLLHIVPGR